MHGYPKIWTATAVHQLTIRIQFLKLEPPLLFYYHTHHQHPVPKTGTATAVLLPHTYHQNPVPKTGTATAVLLPHTYHQHPVPKTGTATAVLLPHTYHQNPVPKTGTAMKSCRLRLHGRFKTVINQFYKLSPRRSPLRKFRLIIQKRCFAEDILIGFSQPYVEICIQYSYSLQLGGTVFLIWHYSCWFKTI